MKGMVGEKVFVCKWQDPSARWEGNDPTHDEIRYVRKKQAKRVEKKVVEGISMTEMTLRVLRRGRIHSKTHLILDMINFTEK